MSADVARLDLRLRRRMLVGCAVVMAAYTGLIVATYPTFRHDPSLDSLTKNSPTMAAILGATGSLTSVDGWLNANLYANFVPLVAFLLTIGYGASTVAGQDEDATLCLAVTLPLSRGRIIGQKTAALAVLAAVVPVVALVCILTGPWFQLRPDWWGLAGASIGVGLMALDLGLLAMLVGTLTGSRGTAMGIAAAVAAASYLVSSLAPVVHWVRPLRYGSLFYWSVGHDQLRNGLGGTGATVLVLTGVVLVSLTLRAFSRFDVH